MSSLAQYITPKLLIPLAVVAAIFCFVCYYWQLTASRRSGVSLPKEPAGRGPSSLLPPIHPMERKDTAPILVITAVYALTAFFQLGSLSAPQSFLDLKDGTAVEIELSQTVHLTKLRYYPGLGTGDYNVEISSDREHWSTLWARKDDKGNVTGYYWANAENYPPSYALPQHVADLFKWLEIEPENPRNIRYLRITGKANYGQSLLELGELALYSSAGESRDPQGLLNISSAGGGITATGADALFDEADTVPEAISWYNSTYFDEIYHPRTAYEHNREISPYETSHPPLGKIIIGLGIRMFGMTPFGWRFMGVLFGVGMVPLLYLFLKNLFGKTVVAACGTALFAFDFMHLTQTRLATIDTYGVFFILLMYYFLYRWLALPAGTPFRKCVLPLFLSGLFWGIGAASKWTVIYGGIGLAALYFIGLAVKLRRWPKEEDSAEAPAQRAPWTVAVLAFSVLCFVVIPAAIYTASYLPYAQAAGVDISLSNTLKGFGESIPVLVQNLWGRLTVGEEFVAAPIPQDSLSGIMAQNQWSMLTYHQGVSQPHPYSSRWYQWIVDARPILYYMDNSVAGQTTRFAAFSNPVVCWTGLLAMLICAASSFKRLWSKAAAFLVLGVAALLCILRADGETVALPLLVALLLLYLAFCAINLKYSSDYSPKALFITVGFLSQLVPWWLISRTTYEYHYFPCLIFLVLAISYLMDGIVERAKSPRQWQIPLYGLTGGAVAAYFLFYPVLVGLPVSSWFSNSILQWLPSWPL